MGWKHLSHTLSKADAQSVLLAMSPDDDLVVVLQELPGLSARQLQCLGSPPAQFQEGSIGVWSLAGDGAGGHQITRPEIAAGDRVMSNLLQWRPVKVLEVRLGDKRFVLVRG